MTESLQNPSPVSTDVDLDIDGLQHGHLSLANSRNESALGSLQVPITVINGGAGPTVTMVGGSHGDEYEGPVTLMKLAASLTASDISGRLILLPCLNAPAIGSATRLSPFDQGNMNRSFPGSPDGTLTEKIADFVTREIIARSDYVLDIHSGGKTMDFTPLAAVHFLADAEQQERAEAAMIAFGAPDSLRMREMDDRGMLDTLVENQGKVFVTTELRGGGTATRESLAVAMTGCRNLLVHTGLLDEPLELRSTRMLEMPDEHCFVSARDSGMLELCVGLGQPVYRGAVIARIHDYKNSGRTAVEYTAGRDGILMARHHPGLIENGDCLAVIAEEVPR